MSAPYLPPVDQLLTLGEAPARQRPWPDYPAMGFTAEHVPELIRMMLDEQLAQADSDSVEVWAGLHAWRTLGQLRADAAIGPLIDLLERGDDSDWVHAELPAVFRMIGPAALEPLRAAVSRNSLGPEPWTMVAASNGLVEIANAYPETRAAVVAALVKQLRWFPRQDPELNGFLVADLLELKAVEAAPAIEEAFQADAVEPSIAGDWEDVQIALGLLGERTTPQPRYLIWKRDLRPTPDLRASTHASASASNAKKRRRKAEKSSRRRNRKRR